MPITVQFATNRVLTGPAEDVHSFSANITPPADPGATIYGTAFVSDASLTADTVGAVTTIQNIQPGDFSDSAKGDLSDPGRNLLVFIHGFDNSFENAITRAAFNTQWFARSGLPAADMAVVAFSWPSLGTLIGRPLPGDAYRKDQMVAGQSGLPIMRFFANLLPIVSDARDRGNRIFLLAHSMGNWALQAAVESWFVNTHSGANMFDEAILAAADEVFSSFDNPPVGRLTALDQLAKRISVYYSRADQVLDLSAVVNHFTPRLGQDGPLGRQDANRYPSATYRMVDCSGFSDYSIDLASSHQYYRRSPGVRTDIANTMAGLV